MEIDPVSFEDIGYILDRIKRKLQGRVKEAYIIGSVVRGYAIRGESDLDLLIVPSEELDFFSLLEEEFYLLLDIGLAMDLIVATNKTYSHLIKEARREGLKLI